MKKVEITAFEMAQRFVGITEVPGTKDNPTVMAMLKLDNSWPQNDEVPWCSAFANYIAWLLRLPRSKSLGARSWLNVGVPVKLEDAVAGFDVVILARGEPPQGHVGFFAGSSPTMISVLGGNQGNKVSIQEYARDRLLGIRRLYT